MVTGNLTYLINLINETAWMTLPSSLEAKMKFLQSRDIISALVNNTNNAVREVEIERIGGLAILPIEGELVPKCSNLESLFGFNSTIRLNDAFNVLDSDPTVQRIVLDIDSVGGAVCGGFEFANDIRNSRKEVIAWSSGFMTSLVYLLASACKIIVTTPSALVGSIGIIFPVMKVDSKDIKVINFKGGEKKDYGSPYTQLSQGEIDYFQGKVDYLYDKFVSTVSEYRNWDKEEIKKTEAHYAEAGSFPEGNHFVDKLMSKNQFLKEILDGII